ncbi:hypothetical protein [Fulvimarina manganoxydans]|nr:hypothetical protein [Fulvimarina manganoxydans]
MDEEEARFDAVQSASLPNGSAGPHGQSAYRTRIDTISLQNNSNLKSLALQLSRLAPDMSGIFAFIAHEAPCCVADMTAGERNADLPPARTTMTPSQPDSLINEQTCPVALDMLAQLIRTDGEAREALIATIPSVTRVKLAFFCYARVHLRTLGFEVILGCELAELRRLAGAKGDLLREQAEAFKAEAVRGSGRSKVITLSQRKAG